MTGFLAAVKCAAVEAVEASKPVAIVNGSIESVNPLRVRIDPKLTLTSVQIVTAENRCTSVCVEGLTDDGANELVIRGNRCMGVDVEELDADCANRLVIPKRSCLDTEVECLDDAGACGLTVCESSLKGLSAGDSVILLRANGGQRYLLLGKGKM